MTRIRFIKKPKFLVNSNHTVQDFDLLEIATQADPSSDLDLEHCFQLLCVQIETFIRFAAPVTKPQFSRAIR